MMGKVGGRRGVGRKKKFWLRNIREWTGIASAAELFRRAKNTQEFTKLTANLRQSERHCKKKKTAVLLGVSTSPDELCNKSSTANKNVGSLVVVIRKVR
ncbi:jg16232 [Pararge aegeria aegeria]|uniref:Jg16232 protein n=1 Tax=Pararge aegeria aegeria TaxID=348720 RepID=A0A8S4RUT8_9NEOP|nr:jg16232 [Pararge aegeria aegeria]